MITKIISKKVLLGTTAILIYLSLVKLIIHLLTLKNYGYFGDELYYIMASNRLSFGYVDIPPVAPFLMAVSRLIFGDSQIALHVFPAIAGALTVFFAGLTARELGGSRFAVFLTALTVITIPAWLAMDSYFTYDPFDIMFSAVFFYRASKLFKRETPGGWLILGAVAGVGLMVKLTMIFLCFGLFAAMILTGRLKRLLTAWPWLAAAAAFIICVPFIIWQYLHGFPLLSYLHNYAVGRPHPMFHQFMLEQVMYLNIVSCPLWIAGLYYLLFKREGENHLVLGLVYPVLLLVMGFLLRLEVREIVPACLPMLAGGAVFVEKKAISNAWGWLKPALCIGLVVSCFISLPRVLPVLPFNAMTRYFGSTPALNNSLRQGSVDGMSDLPLIFSFRLGWPEMVKSVAGFYNSLPESDREKCVIYASYYEEAGAVEHFGKNLGLPEVICNHLTCQFWGPGDNKGEVAIAIGHRFDGEVLSKIYNEVTIVGVINRTNNVVNFERNMPVYICRNPKRSLKSVWMKLQYYY